MGSKLLSAACNLPDRPDRAIGEAVHGLAELAELADPRNRVDLTLRFHEANDQPAASFRLTGRTVTAPLADTGRLVEWDDCHVRWGGSPGSMRCVAPLSLPPIPG
ncbi:hypothetical protein ACFV6E_22240 [Streptomyces sp. NPDC059785]|uniref:hypothetical protein n=1 Tax=Streptomyces sp. NPDC059785 TaxID=3346945 RepID=UPI00365D6D14